MTRPALCILALALLVAPPAAAAAEKKADAAPAVDLTPVGLPIVWDGKLVNYVFVTLHMPLSPHADAAMLRDKAPYFRDALVRISHRTPFVRPWDFTHVDRPALVASMMRENTRIAGPGAVLSVQITDETPQKLMGFPKRP